MPQVVQQNFCDCQEGVEETQGGPQLGSFITHSLSWDQNLLLKLWGCDMQGKWVDSWTIVLVYPCIHGFQVVVLYLLFSF